jgi:hypothetical protein
MARISAAAIASPQIRSKKNWTGYRHKIKNLKKSFNNCAMHNNPWQHYPFQTPGECGTYEVYRAGCKKQHYQTWNGCGWAYDNDDITHWRKVVPPEAELPTLGKWLQEKAGDLQRIAVYLEDRPPIHGLVDAARVLVEKAHGLATRESQAPSEYQELFKKAVDALRELYKKSDSKNGQRLRIKTFFILYNIPLEKGGGKS